MRIRFPLACALLLAACSEPRADRPAAAKPGSVPAAALTAAKQGAASDWDLPDFDDPRQFLDLEWIRWEDWETPFRGNRLTRLQALGITLVRADSTGPREPVDVEETGYDPYGEQPAAFHFIDFSGDGVEDVIYDGAWYERNENGFGALEGSRIKLFQMMDGRAVKVMEHHGSMQRIWKGRAGEPVSFRTLHHGCCSDPEWSIAYFRPLLRGDTVRYEPYHHVLGRAQLQMPARFLSAPRRFTVSNDGYALRDSAGIVAPASEWEMWYRWEGHGNSMAEYGRGARGIALAEQTDSTGRVWWFVRMDGRTPPTAAQVDEPWHDDHPVRADRLGWMSSRFLTPEP